MTQTATQTAQAIATVTLKATGLTYILYPVSSRTSDTTYAVWTINGKPVHCTCKARKFNSHKMCPHMKTWLSENGQPVEAPVCSELKTVFSSVEEEYEYRLHAYGKRSAIGWMYEQKAHTTVEVVATGQAERLAAVAEQAAFAPVEKEEQEVQAYFLGLCQKQPETQKLSAEEANQFFMEQAKRNQAPLNSRQGFQLMR